MFTLRQITDKTGEYNMETHNLLEQRKIVSIELLVAAMKEFGTPVKLARLLKGTVENGQCQEKLQGSLSDLLEGGKVIP